MIFILDLETNTINENLPFTDPKNTEILDRFVYEFTTKSVVSDGLIQNKFKITTGHITGINSINPLIINDKLIENIKSTNKNSTIYYDKEDIIVDKNLSVFKKEMNEIFLYCLNPVFIAHNGKMFDFPILEYHKIIPRNIYKNMYLDSLHFLPIFSKPIKSKKLVELYNENINKNFIQEHRAKSDVMLIVELIDLFDIKTEDLQLMLEKFNN